MTAQTHPTEAALQQFVLHPQECDASSAGHITQCDICKARVAAYRLVFSGIDAQPPASFDFDVAALVMPQLPAPAKARQKTPIWLLAAIALIVMGIPLYCLRSIIADPVTGQWPLFLFFAAPVGIALLIFHLLETHKRYQRQLNNLNFY